MFTSDGSYEGLKPKKLFSFKWAITAAMREECTLVCEDCSSKKENKTIIIWMAMIGFDKRTIALKLHFNL